jgi:monoamine oxidase
MADVDVCVVGAGFAGLTAALRLRQAGKSVALLEARDRVGGRTFTVTRDDGSWIDKGGAWVGPTQDRIYALMNEFGVATFKQYTGGQAMMVVDGKQYRYRGTIPWSMSPWASLNLGAGFFGISQLCKSIPLDAPWEAKDAAKWDRMTLAQWLDKNVMSKAAHDLLDTAVGGCYTSAASEVSMLFVLYQMASGGGPGFVLGGKGASQDARVVGGMGAIYQPMAAELGDAIQLSQPVRHIAQDPDGVTVRSGHDSIRARRVIVAVPLAIASQIIYEPMLPTDRSFLQQRMPSGAIVKISIVYDEPFWRADGLCGQSAAPGTLAPVTIDACSDSGTPGILCVVIEGPTAREYERMDDAERRQAVLDTLVDRFGAKAGKPVDYVEQNWSREPYSAGGMLSHAPPGVLTEFGHALREPCGRIHWAGTESSAKMCGWIDGAIRSGERAATEVMANEAMAAV